MKPTARELLFFIALVLLLYGLYWVRHLSLPPGVVNPPTISPLAQLTPGSLPAPPVAPTLPEPLPLTEGYRCGVERWPVKTLSDLDASRVNLTPIRSTVTEMTSMPRPEGPFLNDRRVAPVELTTYIVEAVAVEFRGEEDNDVHVIIADPNDRSRTMVTEVVDWRCSGAIQSRARDELKQTDAALLSLFGSVATPTLSIAGQRVALAQLGLGFMRLGEDNIWYTQDGPPPPELIRYATIQITGVGFWDVEHGVIGAAPDQIELHPVLSIRRTD